MSVLSRINDTFLAIATELKTWIRIRNVRAVVDSTASGAINTTADYDFLTLSIPANTLKVGDVLDFEVYDLIKKGTGNMSILHYLKVNTTKSANATITLSNAATDSFGFNFKGKLQVRSIVSNVATFTYIHSARGNNTAAIVGSNVVTTLTANVTSNINIVLGANFSVANALNSVRPVSGGIKLW